MSRHGKIMFGLGVQEYSEPKLEQQKLGSSDFSDGWNHLKNPVRDCDTICQCFQEGGYEVLRAHDIKTSEEFENQVMKPLQERVNGRTQVLVGYLAMHAFEDADRELSLRWGSCTGPKDNTAGEQKGMKAQKLFDMLLALPCAQDASIYLFCDICRAGASSEVELSKAGHVQNSRKQLQRTLTIVWACAARQPAWDGKDGFNSPFAEHLCDLLSKPTDWSSIDELYKELHGAVNSDTRNQSKGLYHQQPTLTRSGPESHSLSLARRKYTKFACVPAANEGFTGRLAELKSVDAKFESSGECAIVQTRAITGLGGVGKTQLAKAFAYHRQANYDVILWVDAERDVATSFRECASVLVDLGPELTPRQVKVKVEEFLHQKKWLIVFDNVERACEIENFRPSGVGHVLITSRYQLWDPRSSLELGRLGRLDAILLLHRNIFCTLALFIHTII